MSWASNLPWESDCALGCMAPSLPDSMGLASMMVLPVLLSGFRRGLVQHNSVWLFLHEGCCHGRKESMKHQLRADTMGPNICVHKRNIGQL